MRFYAETLRLPQGTFELLRDLIEERTGLYYDNSNGELMLQRLSSLAIEHGFDSFLDYYYLLKYDAGPQEWGFVIDALAVQETYFWREPDQLLALADHLIPHLGPRTLTPIRIWSTPCASGEEPLSIAIALNERGWFDRAPIEIHATDASPSALEKARRGIYRERSFRNLDSGLRLKYFQQEQEGWRICHELHRRIFWRKANMISKEEIAWLATSPIVFCRNLFIYFSEATTREVVAFLAKSMPKPGYLCIGASESLLRFTTDFDLQEVGGAFVYARK